MDVRDDFNGGFVGEVEFAADGLADGVDEYKRLGDKAHELAKLKELEGWAILQELVKARETQSLNLFTRTAVNAGQAVDQREVDKLRGFIEGAKFVLALPDIVRRRYERKSKAVA